MSKPIIIVGPDCTGKTTLATLLSTNLQRPLKKGTYNIKNKEQWSLKALKIHDVILDRIPLIDEIVYSRAMDQFSTITLTEKHLHLLRNSTIIYINLSTDIIVERLHERGDEFLEQSGIDIESFIERLKIEYYTFFKNYNIKPIILGGKDE